MEIPLDDRVDKVVDARDGIDIIELDEWERDKYLDRDKRNPDFYSISLYTFTVPDIQFAGTLYGKFLYDTPFRFSIRDSFPVLYSIIKEARYGKIHTLVYGVNGAMSVIGSVLAVILSMLFGFTPAFFIGLGFYLIIPLTFRYLRADK